MIDTQSEIDRLTFTLCGDEPPIIHDDEVLDLEVYEATVVTIDEVMGGTYQPDTEGHAA